MRGLILENTFTSIPDMVDHLFGPLSYFKWLILRIRWDSLRTIPHITAPILFLSSDDDEVLIQIFFE
jgi:hypothetical protein